MFIYVIKTNCMYSLSIKLAYRVRSKKTCSDDIRSNFFSKGKKVNRGLNI